jgi:hypothetical protein
MNEFQWINGVIFCRVCSSTVTWAKSIGLHVARPCHQQNREHVAKSSVAPYQTSASTLFNPISISSEEKVYRMNCVKAIARANISLTSLEDLKPWLDYYSKDGLTIGAPMELVRNFAKPVSSSLIHEMRVY